MNVKTFVKERNKALLSLDKDKIIKFLKKYNLKIPENESVFWAGVHKARTAITSFSETEKDISRKWLIDNGFSCNVV